MKNGLLFASLSLISGFSKYRDREEGHMRGMEIEKNSTFIISGTYSNVNEFWGLNVQNTGTEDYFYTFDLVPEGKVIHKGKEISISDLKEGDHLKITYDGNVSLVYPPKLNNVTKIEVVDEEKENKK